MIFYWNTFRYSPRTLLPFVELLAFAALVALVDDRIAVVLGAAVLLTHGVRLRRTWRALPGNQSKPSNVIDFTDAEVRSWTANVEYTWPLSAVALLQESERAFVVRLGRHGVLYLDKRDAATSSDVDALRALLRR